MLNNSKTLFSLPILPTNKRIFSFLLKSNVFRRETISLSVMTDDLKLFTSIQLLMTTVEMFGKSPL